MTTSCAPGRPCSVRHAPTMSRRANCSNAPSNSTRTTLPPTRRSPRPITPPPRWAGRSRRSSSSAAPRNWRSKALSLDSSEVRAHIVLGRIDIFYQRVSGGAEGDRATRLPINPNDAQSLAGRGNILMWLGQTDAAIEALERAERIDPDLKAMDRFALSLAYYLKGRYDAAICTGRAQSSRDRRRRVQPRRSRRRLCRARPDRRCRARRRDDPPGRSDLRSAGVRDEVSRCRRSRTSCATASARPVSTPPPRPSRRPAIPNAG